MIEITCRACSRTFAVLMADVFSIALCPYCGAHELKQDGKKQDKR